MIAHDDVFPYLNADTMVPSMSTTRSSIRAAGGRVAELLSQVLAGKPADDIHATAAYRAAAAACGLEAAVERLAEHVGRER